MSDRASRVRATRGGRAVGLLVLLVLLVSACTGGRGTTPSGSPGTTAPPAPAAGPAPGPVRPSAAAPIGVKWDWPRFQSFTPYLKSLGGGATFYELVWCDVEPKQGQRDWSRIDDVVRSSRAVGASMFLKIRVGGSCWATGGRGGNARGTRRPKTASAMPQDLGAYQSFVRAAVQRYAAMGVHEYAIENEVDAPFFWDGTPQDYERLARLAAAAIRAADPGARVLDGGLTSTVYGAGIADRLQSQGHGDQAVAAWQRYYARRFLKSGSIPRVGSAGELATVLGEPRIRRTLAFVDVTRRLAADRVTDAWQLHFYESWDNLPALLDYLHATLPRSFPVEAWEVGSFWPNGSSDQQLRAAEVTKVVATLLAGGVRPVIWLPLAYNGDGGGSELRFGLLDPNGKVRPAGAAVADLATAARGATWRPIETGSLSGVGFGRGDQSTLVVWSDRGTTLPAPPAGAKAEARLAAGGAVAWGADGLRLGPQPVRITVGAALDSVLKALASPG